MSILSHSLAVLAVVIGTVITAPPAARAQSFSLTITDGDRHGYRRGDDRHHDRGRWHGGRNHWRSGPPPRHRGHRHPPPWRYGYARPHCWIAWSDWHRSYVRICQ